MLFVILFGFLSMPSLVYLSERHSGQPDFRLALGLSPFLMIGTTLMCLMTGALSSPWLIWDGAIFFSPWLIPLGIRFFDSPEGWINYYYRMELLGFPVTPLIYKDYSWYWFAPPLLFVCGVVGWIFGVMLSMRTRSIIHNE